MKIGRLQAFSDGVFSILLTLLVLDFKVPSYQSGRLTQAVLNQWPILVAYGLSFFYVGTLWLFHHDYFAKIKETNWQLNVLNLVILFTVTLINYPTSLLAESIAHQQHNDMQFAFSYYALVALLISAMFWLLYRFMAQHRELTGYHQNHERFYQRTKNDPLKSVTIYLVALIGIQINLWLGAVLMIAGNVFHFIAYLRLSQGIEQYGLIKKG